MHILEYYQSTDKRSELSQLLTLAAQKHPAGLPANFLEKDLWVTEILRLLYDEQLLGSVTVAFKGGTALSKCWKAIERFSEDIDLSIHWADLADVDDESVAWEKSIQSRSQQKKFREQQTKRLIEWSNNFIARLNSRLSEYAIKQLKAELVPDSAGEKINILYPSVSTNTDRYSLDYVLLEFGGRNRGRPIVNHRVNCYLSEIEELSKIAFPKASVNTYDPAYILWEKLTALHQFSTTERQLTTHRLARHWYDADCLLQKGIVDLKKTKQAMLDVVEMKTQRWPDRGVDYEAILNGEICLTPPEPLLSEIIKDHKTSIRGGLFYSTPDSFPEILERVKEYKLLIKRHLL